MLGSIAQAIHLMRDPCTRSSLPSVHINLISCLHAQIPAETSMHSVGIILLTQPIETHRLRTSKRGVRRGFADDLLRSMVNFISTPQMDAFPAWRNRLFTAYPRLTCQIAAVLSFFYADTLMSSPAYPRHARPPDCM